MMHSQIRVGAYIKLFSSVCRYTLDEFVGGLGLAKLLSFLTVDPLLKPDSETVTPTACVTWKNS
jgi:hypothetical protein